VPSSEAAIALLVALAQVGRVMAATNSTRWFAIIGLRNGDDCPEQHKGRVEGEQPGPFIEEYRVCPTQNARGVRTISPSSKAWLGSYPPGTLPPSGAEVWELP